MAVAHSFRLQGLRSILRGSGVYRSIVFINRYDDGLGRYAAAPIMHSDYCAQESDKIRLRREAKKQKGFYVEDEAKVVFVVRIRGINDMHPKVRLQQLLPL